MRGMPPRGPTARRARGAVSVSAGIRAGIMPCLIRNNSVSMVGGLRVRGHLHHVRWALGHTGRSTRGAARGALRGGCARSTTPVAAAPPLPSSRMPPRGGSRRSWKPRWKPARICRAAARRRAAPADTHVDTHDVHTPTATRPPPPRRPRLHPRARRQQRSTCGCAEFDRMHVCHACQPAPVQVTS